VQSNSIPSNDKTVDSLQRGESGDYDDRGDSVAFNENDSEDLRFTQYGTHDENQDDGEVDSQEVISTGQSTEKKAVWSKYSVK